MDQARNRRFSTGQMKSTMTTRLIGTSKKLDPLHGRSGVSPVYDRFRSRECPDGRVIISDEQATENLEDLQVGLYKIGSVFDPDMNRPSHSKTSITKRHVRAETAFAKLRSPPLNDRPCADIGVNMLRFTQEKSFTKQSQSNNKLPISRRRISCPEKNTNSSPNERLDASPMTVMSKRKTRLFDHLYTQNGKSRHSLPKIIESIETLKTGDYCESPGSERNQEMKRSLKSSSPRSFNPEKCTDQIQLGPLESKISIVMSPLTTGMEGNSTGIKTPENKNKIIKITSDGKQHNIVPLTSFNLPTQNDAESSRKIPRSLDIDLVRVSAAEEEFMMCSGKSKQLTRKNRAISPQRRVEFRPKSKNDGANAFLEDYLTKNSEQELDFKVQAFLKSQQPMASPETLKVTAVQSKKAKPVLPNKSVREQRSNYRAFVNTDTCPSTSTLINRDRSWYYQDRTGKCRYLRVPESPVPPTEWVFQHEDAL